MPPNDFLFLAIFSLKCFNGVSSLQSWEYLEDHSSCTDIVSPNVTGITDVSLQYLRFKMQIKKSIRMLRKWAEGELPTRERDVLHPPFFLNVVKHFESLEKKVISYNIFLYKEKILSNSNVLCSVQQIISIGLCIIY